MTPLRTSIPGAAALAWLGRQGTRAVAGLVLVGIFVPSVGAAVKPYVTEAIFILLTVAFLRMDTSALRAYAARPAAVVAATAWSSIVVPILFGLVCLVFDLRDRQPGLFLGLMLQAITSPMMAAPALAALMGLDATLVLVTLVTTTALMPLTAPFFAYVFVGPALSLSPQALGVKLLIILAGSAALGIVLRRLFGPGAIERQREKIDGFNIIILFVFIAAIMEGLGPRILDAPLTLAYLGAVAAVAFLAVFVFTTLIFWFGGRKRALSLGFMASQRNMGLMLAATGGALPDLVWLYFALSQFPIYLSPHLLKSLTRWISGSSVHSGESTGK